MWLMILQENNKQVFEWMILEIKYTSIWMNDIRDIINFTIWDL